MGNAPDASVAGPLEQGNLLRDRIIAATNELEAADEAAQIARERRDELIVHAVETGTSTREIARWARVSQSRICGILAAH